MRLALQIAAGILMAAFVIGLAMAAVNYYHVRQFEKLTDNLVKDMHEAAEKMRTDMENKKHLAEKNQKLRAAHEQQLRDQQAKRLADERAIDQAFQKAYQPPANCTADVAGAEFVECVNHKMRARKEFERASSGGVVIVGPSTP